MSESAVALSELLDSADEVVSGPTSYLIGQLAAECRFRDCQHQTEPGCAVRNAIAANRLESYRKLKRELQHLERRHDAAAQAEQKKTWKQRNKALKLFYKERG